MMMEEYLQQFGLFDEGDINRFLELGKAKSFKKDGFFIREGMVCREVGFVISGTFRSFYYSHKNEEITYCFTFPRTLISAYSSYISGQGTPENIQAITDAEIFAIPKHHIEQLVESKPKWLLFSKIIAEQQYLEMEKRIFTLQKETAEVKYRQLLQEQPEYLQEIPLQFIASYLGITQRHLSRIRKQISY